MLDDMTDGLFDIIERKLLKISDDFDLEFLQKVKDREIPQRKHQWVKIHDGSSKLTKTLQKELNLFQTAT